MTEAHDLFDARADSVIEVCGALDALVTATDLAAIHRWAGRVLEAPSSLRHREVLSEERDVPRFAQRDASGIRGDQLATRSPGNVADTTISKAFQQEDAARALPYWKAERASTLKAMEQNS